MRCPFCKEDHDRVVDSRSSDTGRIIRRRRQCLACRKRFTTYEKIGESFKLCVVKKDSSRVPYDRDKIVGGLQKACYKRPVSAEQIQQIADKVEEDDAEEGERHPSGDAPHRRPGDPSAGARHPDLRAHAGRPQKGD